MLRSVIVTATIGLASTLATHARAFALRVVPIPIVITGGATSAMIEIANEGGTGLRVQAQPFDWSETPAGADKLEPSTELLVFPSMLEIPAGASRKVRVGTQGGYGPREKAFRIIFAEIPSDSSPVDSTQQVVKIVAQVSVPLFVKPPGAVASIAVEALSATKDRVSFSAHNVGNAHDLIEKVHVEFRGTGGKVLSSTEIAGWYVLPGQTRPFEVPLDKHLICAGAKSLVVVLSSQGSGSSTATLDRPSCAL